MSQVFNRANVITTHAKDLVSCGLQLSVCELVLTLFPSLRSHFQYRPSDFQPFSEDRQSDSTDIYQSNGRTVREKSSIQFAIYFQSGSEAAGCEDKVLQCRGKSAALRNQRRRKIKVSHIRTVCTRISHHVILQIEELYRLTCKFLLQHIYHASYHVSFHTQGDFPDANVTVSISQLSWKTLVPPQTFISQRNLLFSSWRSSVFLTEEKLFFPFSLIFIPVAFYLSRMQIFIVIVFLACNFICLLCLVFYFLHQSDLSSVVIVSSVLIAELKLLLILVLVQQTFCLFRGQQKGAKQKNGKS